MLTTYSHPPAVRFFIPRSHRLYALFDSLAAADEGVQTLVAAGYPAPDVWVFEGDTGADELDPTDVVGVARLFSWWFSHNVEYLRGFGRALRAGKVAVAIPASRVAVADRMAKVLRTAGGEGITFTAHWNFVPVSPGPAARAGDRP